MEVREQETNNTASSGKTPVSVLRIDKNTLEGATSAFLVLSMVALAFNAWQLGELRSPEFLAVSPGAGNATALSTMPTSPLPAQSAVVQGIDVSPKGTPRIYGAEVGVSFDDVSSSNAEKANSTIARLGGLDDSITLSGKDLERYVSIAGKIGCEYCCGAPSIITGDGKAACGCSHSYAMRGVAKYLIKNHATEFSDDEVLEELGKWKTLFFPQALSVKAGVLKEKGIELSYINLASNKYRGIEKGAVQGSGMVGGC